MIAFIQFDKKVKLEVAQEYFFHKSKLFNTILPNKNCVTRHTTSFQCDLSCLKLDIYQNMF